MGVVSLAEEEVVRDDGEPGAVESKISLVILSTNPTTPELKELLTEELSPPCEVQPQVITEPSSFNAANALSLE